MYLKRVNPAHQTFEFGFSESGIAYLAGLFEPTERFPMAVAPIWDAGTMLSLLHVLKAK